MRYLVIKNQNSASSVIVWSKSQHQIEIKPNIFRECTHYDYMKINHISAKNISSVGMVYYNVITEDKVVEPSEWITPAPEEDNFFVQKAAINFCKKNPDLRAEIQSDWNEYKAFEKRRNELKAAREKSL